MSITLKVVSLGKKIGAFELKDINFDIQHGDFVSIFGKSGSGKSLLINILSGIDDDYHGDIFLNNVNIRNIPINERKIHTVFSNFYLLMNLTAEENIKSGCTNFNNTLYERLLNIFNIDNNVLQQKVKNISFGQQQRIAIMRAIIGEPKVIILDEPFCHLDVITKMPIMYEFKQIINTLLNDTICIMVSHDIDDILYFNSKLLIINNGNIILYDSIQNIYNYQSTYTVNLLNKHIITIPIMIVDYNEEIATIRVNKDHTISIPVYKINIEHYTNNTIAIGVLRLRDIKLTNNIKDINYKIYSSQFNYPYNMIEIGINNIYDTWSKMLIYDNYDDINDFQYLKLDFFQILDYNKSKMFYCLQCL